MEVIVLENEKIDAMLDAVHEIGRSVHIEELEAA
jgi:hypothetical protein